MVELGCMEISKAVIMAEADLTMALVKKDMPPTTNLEQADKITVTINQTSKSEPTSIDKQYKTQLINCSNVNIGPQYNITYVNPTQSKEHDLQITPEYLQDTLLDHYMGHFKFISPVIWNDSFQLNFDDVFTTLLLVEGQHQDHQIDRSTYWESEPTSRFTEIKLQDILHSNTDDRKLRRILLEGEPGIGKSVLSSKIASDWAKMKSISGMDKLNNTIYDLESFDIVLYIQLRYFEASLEDTIMSQLISEDSNISVITLRAILSQHQEKVLLILDGFDEMPERSEDLEKILSGKMLRKCTVFLTARSGYTKFIRKYFDKILINVGFSKEKSVEFIRRYFVSVRSPISYDSLLDSMKGQSIISDLACNPLNCSIICMLYEDLRGSLPQTKTELFYAFISSVLKRSCIKLAYPDSPEFSIPESCESYCQRIGQVAWVGLQQKSYQFYDTDMQDIHPKLHKLGVLSIGFEPHRLRLSKPVYSFLHKTLQEFMAAYYLARMPITEFGNIVFDLVYNNQNRMVLIFLCGLLFKQNGSTCEHLKLTFKHMKEFLMNTKRPTTGSQYKLHSCNPDKPIMCLVEVYFEPLLTEIIAEGLSEVVYLNAIHVENIISASQVLTHPKCDVKLLGGSMKDIMAFDSRSLRNFINRGGKTLMLKYNISSEFFDLIKFLENLNGSQLETLILFETGKYSLKTDILLSDIKACASTIGSLSCLKSLSLSEVGITLVEEIMKVLPNMIEHLSISNNIGTSNSKTSHHCKSLQLMRERNLKEIIIKSPFLSEMFCAGIFHVNAETLKLHNVCIDTLPQLTSCITNQKHLSTLKLFDCTLMGKCGNKFLKNLKKIALVDLNLTGCSMDETGYLVLLNYIEQNQSLTSIHTDRLVIGGNLFSDEHGQMLIKRISKRSFKFLNVGNTEISTKTITVLTEEMNDGFQLEKLRLSRCGSLDGNNMLEFFKALKKNTSLKELYMICLNLGESINELVHSLESNKILEVLSLSDKSHGEYQVKLNLVKNALSI